MWYAQLWIDGTEPGDDDGHDAPVLWLTPPSYEIQSRQTLAAHIADFYQRPEAPTASKSSGTSDATFELTVNWA